MSFISKLQTALTVVFLLTAGAISIAAQTPVVESPATKSSADAVSTNEPIDDLNGELNKESKKLSAAPAEKTAPSKISADTREVSNATSSEFTGAPHAAAKTATLPKSGVTRSPQAADDDKWHFQFSPYFWLASLHGTGGVGNRTVGVDASFSDVFDTLDFALMGVFEARKGKFILLVDTEYVAVSDERGTPGPFFSNVNAKFKTFIFDPEVGYRLYDDPDKGASIDVLGGMRVWHVSTEFDFGAGILPALNVQGSRNWVDAIVGLRGKTAVSEKVFVTGKFDLGGGGSKFTWQVFGGLGYSIKPNIALIGGYRVLDVNYDKNNFVYDMNQRGPIMGLGFKF